MLGIFAQGKGLYQGLSMKCVCCCRRIQTKMKYIGFVLLISCTSSSVLAQTDSAATTFDGNCRDMLRGFIDGQLSSLLGTLQIDNLRTDFQRTVDALQVDIGLLKAELSAIKENKNEDERNVSVTYTRWGRTMCPQYTETVYSGYVGGSHYTHEGGAAEPVCLPMNPEWGIHTDSVDGDKAFIYGAEYELNTLTDSRKNLHNYNVPCAVCRVRERSSVLMIPGRSSCYPGWTFEYSGYLMAGFYAHKAASTFSCLDGNLDVLPGTQSDNNGYLFYPVEGRCGSLPCPPYHEGRELTCAVCSI